MRRRFIVVAAALVLVAPQISFAQAATGKRRIAILSVSTAAATEHLWAIFRSGLRDLGWIEGDNLTIDMRYAEGDPAQVVTAGRSDDQSG